MVCVYLIFWNSKHVLGALEYWYVGISESEYLYIGISEWLTTGISYVGLSEARIWDYRTSDIGTMNVGNRTSDI